MTLRLQNCSTLVLVTAFVTIATAQIQGQIQGQNHAQTPVQMASVTPPSKSIPSMSTPVPALSRTPAPPELATTADPTEAPEPSTPPARTFHDTTYGISFRIPAAWNLTRKDGDFSTFGLDARTATRSTQMRALASINFNPHPTSTFSGALFYFSVTPKSTAAQCTQQASAQAPRTATTAKIGGVTFAHGYDQHGTICTEARDEIYTALHNNACYRFDLVINNYCGGEVSGVRDISPRELESVRQRMEGILDSVQFDAP